MNGLAGWHPNPSRPAARRDKRYRTGARPVPGAGYNITPDIRKQLQTLESI